MKSRMNNENCVDFVSQNCMVNVKTLFLCVRLQRQMKWIMLDRILGNFPDPIQCASKYFLKVEKTFSG